MKVLVVTDNPIFVVGLMKDWEKRGHEVRLLHEDFRTLTTQERFVEVGQKLLEGVGWSDVVWVEWLTPLAGLVTACPVKRPTFVRAHRYEAWTPWPSQVDWTRVDGLIVSSNALVAEKLRPFVGKVPVHRINLSVDLDEFRPPTKLGLRSQVGVLGYLHARKGSQLIPLVMAQHPKLTFNVKGTFQDPEIEEYVRDCWKQLRNWTYLPWSDDVRPWMRKQGTLLNLSVSEGFPVSILEGMAMGIKPALHAFIGIDPDYPAAWSWRTMDDLNRVFSAQWESAAYREWVGAHWNAATEREAVAALLFSERPKKRLPTLSVAMIVKNAGTGAKYEQNIRRALESVKWADELVVVDTGSSDDTGTIAESFGAKVYTSPWVDDFSAARKVSFEKCTGDFILVLDADEELEDATGAGTRRLLEDCGDTVDGVWWTVQNLMGYRAGKPDFQPRYQMRMVRRGKADWIGAIHNDLIRTDENSPSMTVDLALKHYGYCLPPEDYREKVRSRLQAYRRDVADHPEDPRPWFHLQQALLVLGEHDEAYSAGEKVLEVEKGDRLDFRAMALYRMARTKIVHEDFDGAATHLQESIKVAPTYMDAYFWLGRMLYRKGDWPRARGCFHNFVDLALKMAATPMFTTFFYETPAFLNDALWLEGECAWEMCDQEHAVSLWIEAASLRSTEAERSLRVKAKRGPDGTPLEVVRATSDEAAVTA